MLFRFVAFLFFTLSVFLSDVTLFNWQDQEKEIKKWQDWVPFVSTTVLTFIWICSINELGKLIFSNFSSGEDLYKSILAFVTVIIAILLIALFKMASLPEYALYVTQAFSNIKHKRTPKNNN